MDKSENTAPPQRGRGVVLPAADVAAEPADVSSGRVHAARARKTAKKSAKKSAAKKRTRK